MVLLEKFKALGMAASWDSCGSVKQKSFRDSGIPAEYSSFVHDCSGSASENCRLVKVLQSNSCVHDCKYCMNTCKNRKFELEPMELAMGFDSLARKGFVTDCSLVLLFPAMQILWRKK